MTVRALVKPERVEMVEEGTYLYCSSPACDVVYSSPTIAARRFLRADVRVRVGEKETEPPIPVCYCFDWTTADIEHEIGEASTTSIRERIRTKIQEGFCHCETMNPRGTCCLGAVSRAEEEARKKMEPTDKSTAPSPVDVSHPSPAPPRRGIAIAAGGAILASLAASACCWLPLLLVGTGLSAAGVSGFSAGLRPVLLPVSVLLLGAAWIAAYRSELARFWSADRRRLSATGNSLSAAAPATDDCCAPPAHASAPPASVHGRGPQRTGRTALWASTLAVVVLASFPRWSGLVLAESKPVTSTAASNEPRSVLAIEGMTCEGCTTQVQNALLKVAGVKSASVSYERKEAVVVTAPGVTEASLVKAVEAAGFHVSGKAPSAPSTACAERPAGCCAVATKASGNVTSLPVLRGSLKPLADQFNADRGKLRALALLSPT